MRLIDADALMEVLVRERTVCHDCSKVAVCIGDGCSTQAVIRAIISAPTIDAAPVRRGEWLEVNPMFKGVYQCSACGTYIGMSTRALTEKRKDFYCSECGADMKPVRDPENDAWRA